MRLRNRYRRKGWDEPTPDAAIALLDAVCPAPSMPWDAGERYFGTDIPELETSALIAERELLRFRLLHARPTEHLPWHHRRLERIDRELTWRNAA